MNLFSTFLKLVILHDKMQYIVNNSIKNHKKNYESACENLGNKNIQFNRWNVEIV